MTALEQLSNNLDPVARTCRGIIETPAGSHAKFAYDPESGLFQLGKLLPMGLTFTLDFGFIPSTCWSCRKCICRSGAWSN